MITRVEILKWMIKVGDSIKKGDPLAEIEFVKATIEIGFIGFGRSKGII